MTAIFLLCQVITLLIHTVFNFGLSNSGTLLSSVKTIPAVQNLGEYLESFNDLNTVALNTDAVFVYIPDTKNTMVDDTTKTAIIKAKQVLTGSNVNVGLYTLAHNSTEYYQIEKQLDLPVLFIARKGASAVTVPCTNVDEYTLLQACLACCDT